MDDFAHNRNATPLPQTLKSFDWYTRIIDLFPTDWALADRWSHEKATIRDVLTHVSGLSGYAYSIYLLRLTITYQPTERLLCDSHDLSYTSSDSPVDVIRRMHHLRPSFGLREKFQYNNQVRHHHPDAFACTLLKTSVRCTFWRRTSSHCILECRTLNSSVNGYPCLSI